MKITKSGSILLSTISLTLTSCNRAMSVRDWGDVLESDSFTEFYNAVQQMEEADPQAENFLFSMAGVDYEDVNAFHPHCSYAIAGYEDENDPDLLNSRLYSATIIEYQADTDMWSDYVAFCYFEYTSYFPVPELSYRFVESRNVTLTSYQNFGINFYVSPKQYNLEGYLTLSDGSELVVETGFSLVYSFQYYIEVFFDPIINALISVFDNSNTAL